MDIEFYSDTSVMAAILEDSNSFVVFGLHSERQNEGYVLLSAETSDSPLSYRFNISQEFISVFFQDNSIFSIRLDIRVYKYPMKYLWISWYEKILRMGRGSTVGDNIILTTSIDQIPNFYRFQKVGFFSKGKARWRFSNYNGKIIQMSMSNKIF